MFIKQPSNTEVALTAHSVAQFSCHHDITEGEGTLEWIINSKSYHLTELPSNYIIRENGNILEVTNITNNNNNTLYQCQIIVSGADKCAYRSNVGKLIVRCSGKLIINQ